MLARLMTQECLGIFIGQNEKQCFDLNWTKITLIMKISLNPGEKKLTIFGKTCKVDFLAISKLIYEMSILIKILKERSIATF